MNKKVLLIIGILVAILGAGLFFERGFFASTLLGARVMGNMGWDSVDASKIHAVAIAGGVLFAIGVIMTITGVFKKENSQPENSVETDEDKKNRAIYERYKEIKEERKDFSEPDILIRLEREFNLQRSLIKRIVRESS